MSSVGIKKYIKLFNIKTTIKKIDKNSHCLNILNSIYSSWSAYKIETCGKKNILINKKDFTIYSYKFRHLKLDSRVYNMVESLPYIRFPNELLE